jgi:DNA-binding CsgD family transcriptional regulator
MATLPAFFLRYLDVIYLLYGLALFTMGVVVWLEASRPTSLPLARPLPFLALFGILHGFHEWGEWFVPIHQASHPIPLLADLTLLALAFFLLAEFGLRLLSLDGWPSAREARLTLGLLFLVGEGMVAARWGGEPNNWVPAADAWARYALAIPAALLAAVGLCRHSRCLTRAARGPAADLRWAGLALALYAVPGQVFVAAGPLPPSNWLNDIFFLRTFGIPIQLWRAVMAGLLFNAGAEGYIPKRASPEDLVQAIRVVARGEVYLYPTLAGLLVRGYLRCLQAGQAEPEQPLTPRQQEVLRLLAEGLTSREIAERLGLSVKTVEHHRENIMERLGLRTRADLIRYALQKGLIS